MIVVSSIFLFLAILSGSIGLSDPLVKWQDHLLYLFFLFLFLSVSSFFLYLSDNDVRTKERANEKKALLYNKQQEENE